MPKENSRQRPTGAIAATSGWIGLCREFRANSALRRRARVDIARILERSPGHGADWLRDQLSECADAAGFGNRRLQLRINFVEATSDQPQPLARLLRGGRGGAVRLKLYMAMLWMAAKEPHDVTFPDRAWAELFRATCP